MKNKLNHNDIVIIYRKCLNNAYKNYKKGNFEKACRDLYAIACCGYQSNFIYTDPDAENLLHNIGDRLFKKRNVCNPNSNRIVLLDTTGVDNHGLTQQYLRAMMHNEYEILFITLRENIAPLSGTISELHQYGDKCHILNFENKSMSDFDKVENIADKIIDFAPSKIFLHIMPWDYVSLLVLNTISGVTKYNINLTDHAYWLGASFFDYNIEMRPYGKTVSLEKRGFKKEQILELPFYPITTNNESDFEGFPVLPNDAIIIFTGGSPYKMAGDNDFFFKEIINSLLNISERVHILVAGFEKNSKIFDSKKTLVHCGDRLHNIGIRRDINEVFKRCDIYLGTYPIMGGLMSQYAAIYGKPIIAMKRKGDQMSEVGSFVNHFDVVVDTFDDIGSFLGYSKKLIFDLDFRHDIGVRMQKAVMTEDRFFKTFKHIINTGHNIFEFPMVTIDYDAFESLYIDVENNNHSLMYYLAGIYKFKALFIFYDYLFDIIPQLLKRSKRKLCFFEKNR